MAGLTNPGRQNRILTGYKPVCLTLSCLRPGSTRLAQCIDSCYCQVSRISNNVWIQVFYPIDYRIYVTEQDGKAKNEHFREMLLNAKNDKGL
jgi:hypothetical protein